MIIKKKIIFICTGNSCRSQIAHGLLQNMAGEKFEVFSAGSHPSKVHPMSIKVMDEIGINITHHTSDSIDDYLNIGIDIAITLCDNANKNCPIFEGNIKKIHWSIENPFKHWSFDESQIQAFREVREKIRERIIKFLEY
tara:strand:+ start:783 stop:1199 length:417 start_codon:yes stop_codon:yes gene_type:complete